MEWIYRYLLSVCSALLVGLLIMLIPLKIDTILIISIITFFGIMIQMKVEEDK